MANDPHAQTPLPEVPRPAAGPLRSAMNGLAAVFGVTPSDRTTRVATMLAGGKGVVAGYWLQLMLAMAIATFGLVLGSTAVVIGAMLVSPLMTPILGLGMGLAVGSPLLVVRSAIRVGASVIFVVMSASVITLILPIHELTTEISSRTSPNLLDLAIASCCAVAGVYAVIRPGSDTASAAAGTAIGIALVPPLCVVGYGLGTSSLAISSGAALLFTANFCAILFFSVLGFIALGYGSVPIATLEREYAEDSPAGGITARLARRVSVFFASRFGPVARLVMPLMLVVAVFWPLRQALVEVTWEIRVRTAAREALREITQPSVHSSIRVERGQVSVRLVTVGDAADAARLRSVIARHIAEAAGVEPTVEVVAVPDAKSLARVEAAPREPVLAATPVVPRANLAMLRRDAESALALWPVDVAGPLMAWTIGYGAGSDVGTFEVVHVGQPLGDAGESLLSRSLSNAFHEDLKVRDVVFERAPFIAPRSEGAQWFARAGDALGRLHARPELTKVAACVETPTGSDVAAISAAVRASAAFQDPRVTFSTADVWSLRFSDTPCATEGATISDGGSDAPTLAEAGRP